MVGVARGPKQCGSGLTWDVTIALELSMDSLTELTQIADERAQKPQSILAVTARRAAKFGETLEGISETDGLAEGRFAEHRLVSAQDSVRAAGSGPVRMNCLICHSRIETPTAGRSPVFETVREDIIDGKLDTAQVGLATEVGAAMAAVDDADHAPTRIRNFSP